MSDAQQQAIKLAICVPARGSIEAGFLANYIKIFVQFMQVPGVIPVPFFSDAMPVDEARNQITTSALIARCDYFLWLDADVFPDPKMMVEMFDYLRKNDDVQAVSGIYFLRAPPYEPVIRKLNDLDVMAPIGNFDTEKPFQIDGAGFGCIIHKKKVMADVYNATKGKPFQFTPKAGEDLFWCRQAAAHGNKIMCYPKNLCGHWGAFVGEWHFLHYQNDRVKEGRELGAYLKISPGDVYVAMLNGVYDIVRQWKNQDPKTPDEIDKFHRQADYLAMLTKGAADGKIFGHLYNQMPRGTKKILDFGCGIGENGIGLIEQRPTIHCDFYDINDANLKYLKWRIDQRILQKTITDRQTRIIDKFDSLGSEYDCILAIDVLDFIPDAEGTLKKLREKLTRNGILFLTMSPKESAISLPIPMRVSATLRPMECGFIPVGPFAWVRDDSDIALRLSSDEKKIVETVGKV